MNYKLYFLQNIHHKFNITKNIQSKKYINKINVLILIRQKSDLSNLSEIKCTADKIITQSLKLTYNKKCYYDKNLKKIVETWQKA